MASTLLLLLVSAVSVAYINALDLSNWMGIKKESLWNKNLRQLTILGTHDSGAYNLTSSMLPGAEPEYLEALIEVAEKLGLPLEEVITDWSEAQPGNLYDSMMNGVRYIDLRCGWMQAWQHWVAFHGEAGQSIHKLVSDVRSFLDTHTNEIVLIEASHLDGNPTETQKQWLVNNFTTVFNGLLFGESQLNNSIFPTFADMIESGKRVFLSLDDALANDYDLIWRGSVFENTYANTADLAAMIEFNDEQMTVFNANETKSDALFKISWTLTPQTATVMETLLPRKPHSLMDLANEADAAMWEWASQQLNNDLTIANVFLFDNYLNASVAQIINAIY